MHTPTPWRVERRLGSLMIRAQEVDVIAIALPDCEPSEANAEFIVRACNAHDELLGACRDATVLRGLVEKVEWMKRHADDLRSDCNEGSVLETEMQINAIIEKIRTAIAKDEGSIP